MKKLILVSIFVIISMNAFGFKISKLNVQCLEKSCQYADEEFKSLVREYQSFRHFEDVLKLYVGNEGVKELSYEVKNSVLTLFLSMKPILRSIEEPIIDEEYDFELPEILPIKVDDYFDESKIEATKKLYKEYLRDKGYPYAEISENVNIVKRGVELQFSIKLGRPVLVQNILINTDSLFMRKYINKALLQYKNNIYDSESFKIQFSKLKSTMISFGYYLSDLSYKVNFGDSDQVEIVIDVFDSTLFAFVFDSDDIFETKALKKSLNDSILSYRRKLNTKNIENLVRDFFIERSFYNVLIQGNKIESINIHGDKQFNYVLDIKKGRPFYIDDIYFKGNNSVDNSELKKLFYHEGSDLVSGNRFDDKYVQNFSIKLREFYISKGFVNVIVDKPQINFDYKREKVLVSYKIREGVKASVSSINITGVDQSYKTKILELLSNQPNKAFNPISFKEDLDKINSFLLDEGFYYVEIKNRSSKGLVEYSRDFDEVNITIDIETGQKVEVEEIIIIGNKDTRKILIKRELAFRKGDLLTSSRISESISNLLRLGIFSSIQIKPVSENTAKTDVLIFVREKDFGVFEVAPGVRSDLGFKLSTSISYNNIDGLNKRISFKSTINKRFDLDALDDERKDMDENLLEYDAQVNFSERHIFYSDYDVSVLLSQSRKRYFSFDADIKRLGYTITREFSPWFSASFKQQLEAISQYNSTVDKEHGHFRIGSVTPTLTFDFRDRPIASTSGAMFELSYERASPDFGSQDSSEIVVDYYKLTSRNKFYIPLGTKFVLASSLTFGIQENYAVETNDAGSTVGYIPGIKVFRLSGVDNVRGYEDDEINTISSGEDISEVEVNLRAYMANIKIEPRYFLSDTSQIGLFYDAGRIFVGEFDETQLRSSVGLSFKYVTPVGTLDFDYGIKLLRKRDNSGNLESPGRLHVSIGFF